MLDPALGNEGLDALQRGDGDLPPRPEPRDELAVIDGDPAKGGLSDAVLAAMLFDAGEECVGLGHNEDVTGDSPYCQWAKTHGTFTRKMGSIPQ